MDKVKYLILGHGSTGHFLIEKIKAVEPNVETASTSRKGKPLVEFDLADSTSWDNLPNAETTFWTFPPEPEAQVKAFYHHSKRKLGKVIVVGSTSALTVAELGQEVNEETPLDEHIERVRSEVFLREQGAVLLLSAGIYGPGRNPLDWVKKGWVGKNSKWVNMVHLQDLAEFLYQACQHGVVGRTYIACNNNPQSWRAVIENWESRGLVKDVPEKASQRTSKKINNSRSIKDLQVNLRFQNFADSVS